MAQSEPMNPPALDYAPMQPWHRRRRARRRAAWIGGVLLLAWFAWAWGPPLLHRAELLYWQRRCMNHTYPPGTVVADAKTALVPREWINFYTLATGIPPRSYGTAWLHAMRSPDRTEKLVAIDLIGGQRSTSVYGELLARVFEPATLLRPPKEVNHVGGIRGSKPCKIIAAQIDSSDPSHVVMQVAMQEEVRITNYTMDGWLKDDGSFIIDVRDPLTSPAPPSPPSSR